MSESITGAVPVIDVFVRTFSEQHIMLMSPDMVEPMVLGSIDALVDVVASTVAGAPHARVDVFLRTSGHVVEARERLSREFPTLRIDGFRYTSLFLPDHVRNHLFRRSPYVTVIASDASLRRNGLGSIAWAAAQDGNVRCDCRAFRGSKSRRVGTNTLEVVAAIRALTANYYSVRAHNRPIVLLMDSQPAIRAVQRWLDGDDRALTATARKMAGSDFSPARVHRELRSMAKERLLTIRWVRAHDGHALNTLADQLAKTVNAHGVTREQAMMLAERYCQERGADIQAECARERDVYFADAAA